MSVRSARPTFRLASGIVLGSFTLGFAGAFGAHALETQVAVSDARAAAQELSDRRADLEGELAQADAAITDAQVVVAEERVAAAAEALSRATRSATAAAEARGVVLPAGTDDAPAPSERVSQDVLPEPSKSPAPETTGADETPRADRDVPTPDAQAPAMSPEPSVSDNEVMNDADVVRVLAGDTDSADEAREAARRLEEAVAVLDDAVKAVGDGSQALSAAALEAAHPEALDALDAEMVVATAEVHATREIFDIVLDQVHDDEPLTLATTALADLDSAVATAVLVDREDPLSVVRQRDRILAERGDLTAAMEELRVTHETWLRSANQEIDARNEALRTDHEGAVDEARAAHVQANRDAAAARPNGWSGRPAGITGSNGRLGSMSMCPVAFAPGHRLQCDAARALEEANAAYVAQTGHDLKLTDSYRSYGLQVRTRALKPTTAARPGTSNHGWGMAVDLDPKSSAWLTANGQDFGWVHPSWAKPGGSKPESWHLEYVGAGLGGFEPPAPPELEERIPSAFGLTAASDE